MRTYPIAFVRLNCKNQETLLNIRLNFFCSVLSNQVMSGFNMDGNRGKKAFKSTVLYFALRGEITFPQH